MKASWIYWLSENKLVFIFTGWKNKRFPLTCKIGIEEVRERWGNFVGCQGKTACIIRLSNSIWNITILRSLKQQIWLRTALCGGWCRRMALRNRELHARNDDDASVAVILFQVRSVMSILDLDFILFFILLFFLKLKVLAGILSSSSSYPVLVFMVLRLSRTPG